MSESLEYIEAYFEKQLSMQEKQIFEERCIQDTNFAGEVAFYISSRKVIRQTLLEQKRNQWSVYETVPAINEPGATTALPSKPAPVKKMPFRKWIPYVAAACLLLAVATYFFYSRETTHQLANKYVKTLTHIDQNMGSADSLQQGINAYNKGEYDIALSIFQNVYQAYPDHSDAKEYIGLVYLMKEDYDKALIHFDELSQRKDLVSNPGVFLKAVTLLKRDKKGDKEAAKAFLKQVVQDEKLGHKKEAAEWLKKWS